MRKAIIASTLSLALLAGGTSLGLALHKDVQLQVDGESVDGGAFALTVADLLAAKGIELQPGDQIQPALDTPLQDGDQVQVRYRKPLQVELDGDPITITTTATTLSAALAEHPMRQLLATSELSLNPSTVLPREGLTVEASTPKQIKLKVAGKLRSLTTTAATVAELLIDEALTPGAQDRLSPDLDHRISTGDEVVLDRITVSTDTRKESVPFETVEQGDKTLWKGESALVSSGVDGKAIRTYSITKVNGKVTDKVKVAERITRKPVNQVRRVGTKTTANGVGINLARAAMWDRIARCESTNRWHINTGNGYYGGLQFSRASWNANGGRDFAALPHQASRAEQITVANRYYAKAGLRPWSCKG